MISAPEAARYPFFAPLSGYHNEIGIGDRFLFSGAHRQSWTHEHSAGHFKRKSCRAVRSPGAACASIRSSALAGTRTRESATQAVLRLSGPSWAGPV